MYFYLVAKEVEGTTTHMAYKFSDAKKGGVSPKNKMQNSMTMLKYDDVIHELKNRMAEIKKLKEKLKSEINKINKRIEEYPEEQTLKTIFKIRYMELLECKHRKKEIKNILEYLK